MLYLFTGQPGNGKTLNAIKFLNEHPEFKDRPKYVSGVTGLQFEDWHEFEDPKALAYEDFSQLPKGCVALVDEAHKHYPTRLAGKNKPAYIDWFAEHRHWGIDIILVTQMPKEIDVGIRRRVNRHWHFRRKFGRNQVIRYQWEECSDDIDKMTMSDAVDKSVINLDKKYFGTYDSAVMHTHKEELPKKVKYGIPLVLAAIALIVVYAVGQVQSLGSGAVEDIAQAESEILQSDTQPEFPIGNLRDRQRENYRLMDENAWRDLWKPRVPGATWTAPVYDELMKAQEVPKPNCVSSKKDCRCYSQQATRIPVPEAICRRIVEDGWFDPTKRAARI